VKRRQRLDLAFFGVVAIMAAHQGEHVAQVVQKDGAAENCPRDCRGLLGSVFDIEEVHLAYNALLFAALGALWFAYRMWQPEWRRRRVPWVALTAGIFVIQGYHVVEHVAKIEQWLSNGRVSPTPGLLGQLLDAPHRQNFSLIELHFVFNTIVFICVLFGYFGFRLYKGLAVGRRSIAWAPAVVVVLSLASSAAAAWERQTPTMRLAAGEHDGPIVLDRAQKLVGEPGAVVRGGIVVRASGVTVRDVTVIGGEHGITIDGARGVLLDNVRVVRAGVDGINIRRGSARIRDCTISSLQSPYAQGIDISFSIDLEPTLVQGCRISGGQEGIVTHWAKVMLRGNHVTNTTLRGITVTEMSMGTVQKNRVEDGVGVGIFCGDYSHCQIKQNRVFRTRPDPESDDGGRAGIGIYAYFGAIAELHENELVGNARATDAFSEAVLRTSR
jgi:parallel beta helix pectate lyase-like protein